LSLKVFEARYVDMTAACLRDHEPFGICPIRSGKEVGLPAQPAEVGTLAWIRAADVTQTASFSFRWRGQHIVVEETRLVANKLCMGRVTLKPEEPPMPLDAGFAPCLRLLQAVAQRYPEAGLVPLRDEMPWVGFRLAEILPLRLEVRQALLEMNDGRMPLQILLDFIRRQRLA
jgi:Lon protease-like protein